MIIGIDVGGTFTDIVRLGPGGPRLDKVPSTPDAPERALLAAIDRLDPGADAQVAHGTTVATNTLLERSGARTVLVTTEGFGDILALGRGERPSLFDLNPRLPVPLVQPEDCVEVPERIGPGGEVLRRLSEADARKVAERVAGLGGESVAVSFLFSFLEDAHERAVADALAARVPDRFISLSSRVLPEAREYERTSTTVANAYVGPTVGRYLARLTDGLGARPMFVMASHGGILGAQEAARYPVGTLLSGPAAGVSGALAIGETLGATKLLTFDMGGTSTDVAVCRGELPLTDATVLDGIPIQRSTVDVHTIGAGGGSIIRIDGAGAIRVGPDSAGARPGPAAYGHGGTRPTLTDAHVALGHLPAALPLAGGIQLDRDAARCALSPLADEVGASVMDVARRAIEVAEARMERAIRRVSVERGIRPGDLTMMAFGGAGPLHACRMAERIGMERVIVPAMGGHLSALGLLVTPRAATVSRSVLGRSSGDVDGGALRALRRTLEADARGRLASCGDPGAARVLHRVQMRYVGQSYSLSVDATEEDPARWTDRFRTQHRARYGFTPSDGSCQVVTMHARAELPALAGVPSASSDVEAWTGTTVASVAGDDGEVDVAVIPPGALVRGFSRAGPAIVPLQGSTLWVPGGWGMERLDGGHLLVRRHANRSGPPEAVA